MGRPAHSDTVLAETETHSVSDSNSDIDPEAALVTVQPNGASQATFTTSSGDLK